MSDAKSEGVVLKSIDFRDRSRIITLFTPDEGIVSLIVKGITRKKSHLLTLTTPFTRGEYHYLVKKSSLYTFRDGTPLATHSEIRKSLAHIEVATEIASHLIASQVPGKAAEALYKLTLAYLEKLADFEDPTPLSASFLLKLLKVEGHLHLTSTCAACELPANALASGESVCTKHRPPFSHSFSSEEWQTLLTLSEARAFSQIKSLSVPKELRQRLKQLFHEKIS